MKMKKMFNSILVLAIGLAVGIGAYNGVVKFSKYVSKPTLNHSLKDLPSFVHSENGIYNKITGSNPLIRIHDEDDEFVCSGIIISSKYLLTAAHCISDDDGNLSDATFKIHVLMGDGSVVIFDGKAASLNHRSDNGVIIGEFTNLSTLRLALGNLNSLQRSQNVAACGFPYGSEEDICYILGPVSQQYYFQMVSKGYLYPGMSGGPVWDMENRAVIGVNSAAGNGYVVTTTLVGLFESLKVKVVQ